MLSNHKSELHRLVDEKLVELATSAQRIFEKKQKEHGDRWEKLSKNQLLNIVIMKANRLIGRKKRKPEDIEEEVADMINYSVMYFAKVVKEDASRS